MSIICIQSINEKKNHIRYEVDTDSQPLGVGGMGSVYRGKRIQEKFVFDDDEPGRIDPYVRECAGGIGVIGNFQSETGFVL